VVLVLSITFKMIKLFRIHAIKTTLNAFRAAVSRSAWPECAGRAESGECDGTKSNRKQDNRPSNFDQGCDRPTDRNQVVNWKGYQRQKN